jgi:hypothetical protein
VARDDAAPATFVPIRECVTVNVSKKQLAYGSAQEFLL